MTGYGSLLVSADQKVLVGRPAQQVSEGVMAELSRIVSRIPGCIEAHLPQVFVLGVMPTPRTALTVVIDESQNPNEITQYLNEEISNNLQGLSIDSWILNTSDPLLDAVRNAQCAVP